MILQFCGAGTSTLTEMVCCGLDGSGVSTTLLMFFCWQVCLLLKQKLGGWCVVAHFQIRLVGHAWLGRVFDFDL